MMSMTTPALTRAAGPLTRADLDAMRDDGRRRELIDGALIVTPGASYEHQDVLQGLLLALLPACPAELKILFAPFDVALADDTILEPDLLVARRADFTSRDLPVAPLLAAEVLSPSTRRIDLTLKRSRYEAAGTASYWVVDPDGPSLTAWELVDKQYVEVAHVAGDEEWTASQPFAVSLRPSALHG